MLFRSTFKVDAGRLNPFPSLLNTTCLLLISINTTAGLAKARLAVSSLKALGIWSIVKAVYEFAVGVKVKRIAENTATDLIRIKVLRQLIR